MRIEEIGQIMHAVPTALLLIDQEERVRAANEAADRLLGNVNVGRRVSATIRHPEFLGAVESCLREGTRQTRRIVRTEGWHDTHLAVTITALDLTGERLAMAAFEDVTPLEQAGAMRRDFVANVSHELRTPLTALIGFIETLRGPARDDAAARDRFLAVMEREAGRMIRLVGDLLSLSRVESMERSRPSSRVDLIPILRTVVSAQSELAQSAQVTIRADLPDGSVWVVGDADQLTQVFHNLVENAVKYGGSGGEVRIEIGRIERDPILRGPAISVSVSDRGEGIDPIHIPRLTERFYRVDTHRSREKGGTGLGLAIVKHIVNRHRGRLRIDSAPGKGSRFTVILPEQMV
ncbi:two-component system phosphate regulon sensor histidine kinase PhoR [Albidovulum inexpectatum]|uniref:histidine kinase n=1 Tax=Albidovulum inexpectatum TaxID=196587 RepID=A0A2S5JJ96_9RHOB|nr:ATP-binding protein [Albidovulum inexpectatum]PPB81523.1 two-component system phosphate regulon sensor histidine kinase PhoR [Albidovulum inexpectatum]